MRKNKKNVKKRSNSWFLSMTNELRGTFISIAYPFDLNLQSFGLFDSMLQKRKKDEKNTEWNPLDSLFLQEKFVFSLEICWKDNDGIQTFTLLNNSPGEYEFLLYIFFLPFCNKSILFVQLWNIIATIYKYPLAQLARKASRGEWKVSFWPIALIYTIHLLVTASISMASE